MSISVRSRVAWGAIFAGTLMAIALFLVLGSLWAAIDLTSPRESEVTTPIFVAILSLGSMFVGGWTTARLCAGESTGEALFYGAILWSMTALILLWLAINGILVLGSGTLLGQTGSLETAAVSKTAAWWGFTGVVLSLLATLGGVLAGFTRRTSPVQRPADASETPAPAPPYVPQPAP